ncbi:DUF4186 family protein [Paenibacillus sp. HW567]|uniref:DUF4186 family protein n=1 Tax=Paenibacillus sp. HW567 TaxID=1034769 RepID=UPI00035E4E1F|nr:DUF4186 family protein [Paenibacillus sp. HW567]
MDDFDLPPLNIKCTDSDCENDLHCFLSTKKMAKEGKTGSCRNCGVDLVDWDRTHMNEVNDVDYKFHIMKKEMIRHHFWHVTIDQKAINYAKRKGRIKLTESVKSRLKSSVGSASPYRDGQQTPFKGNPIYYAQHATATCCRRCIEEWHDIPKGRELTESELEYMCTLVNKYLSERIPSITEGGEKVPVIRRGGVN